MNKTTKIILIILSVALIIGLISFIFYKNSRKEIKEYAPEEEISEEQVRETIVSLYFRNKTTKSIEPEARLIDVKKLISNPYEILINLLIQGPKNENLEKTIPEGTILRNAKIEGETLIINFSKEFVDNHTNGKEIEEQTIKSIVSTMTELNEINSIKILIEGEENKGFKDDEINFKENFIRTE